MKNVLRIHLILLICIIGLTACGGNNAGNNGAAESSPSPTASPAESASPSPEAEAPATRVIEHAMGKVELDDTPATIVVLEWTYAEHMLTLGVQPAGMADKEGYANWVNVEPALAEDVVDVGTRQEPNLEAIAALQPDLIIAEGFRVKESYEQLDAIAPTLVFDSYSEQASGAPYDYMIETFRTVAEVLDKQSEADAVLAELDQSFADAKAKLEEAGKAGAPIVVAQAFSSQNAAALRLFTDNSLAIEAAHKIGLSNAFESETFQAYGYEQTSVESLANVQDANFLYVVQESDNVFENQLKDNAVWNGLNFVKEGRAYSLGGDTWLFGGVRSAQLIVDKYVELLTQ